MPDLPLGTSAFTAEGWPDTFYKRVTFRVPEAVCYRAIREKTDDSPTATLTPGRNTNRTNLPQDNETPNDESGARVVPAEA